MHKKYFALAEKGSVAEGDLSQGYERLTAEDLSKNDANKVDRWIWTAETYAGDEKRFVDDLIAVTPGTIDLEMGLPADNQGQRKKRSAPRMDIVVAQGGAIAFWEAKCATNSELRARAVYQERDGEYIKGPHVLWQLRRYEKWVRNEDRLTQVRDTYVKTASLFLKLAQVFEKTGMALTAWRALVDASEAATVILPPGIVVANYCPRRADGKPRDESASYEASAKSFHDHKARLKHHGACVLEVRAKPTSPVLPSLIPGTITETEQSA